MKKTLLLLTILSFSSSITAQVKVNQNAANSAINTSSAFMDASSSPLWNGTTNQGKGMLYPRVDLVNYTAMSHAGPFNASNNPNYFDGLLVFNTATGIAGIGGDSVFPGYYYYRNTTTTANGGHWVSLKGIKGDDGAIGPIGPQGVQGIAGNDGLTGATGAQGPTGVAGANGSNGATGAQGPTGLTGASGTDGTNGTNGLTGATGPQGIQGPVGNDGSSGPQGPIGLTGATGPQGIQGTTGNDGATGPQGPIGLTGPAGTNGSNGQNALIKTTTEPVGANCANGGTKIETGLDANGNGTLEPGEINASQTKYVCNGVDGTQGFGFSHFIGEQYGGGVIFHLWRDNLGIEHGLIVTLLDQSTSQVWSNVSLVAIGPSAQSTWDGLSNSNAIVSQSGHLSSAAKLCLDLVLGGKSDWYLPAVDELSILWQNRFDVNKALTAIVGATPIGLVSSANTSLSYWSSTERNIGYVWDFNFIRGGGQDGPSLGSQKTSTFHVRAIRAF